MPQITLYLDADAIQVMRECARGAQMPYSRWVSNLIRSQVTTAWRPEIESLFGRYHDMPRPDRPVLGNRHPPAPMWPAQFVGSVAETDSE